MREARRGDRSWAETRSACHKSFLVSLASGEGLNVHMYLPREAVGLCVEPSHVAHLRVDDVLSRSADRSTARQRRGRCTKRTYRKKTGKTGYMDTTACTPNY